MGKATKVKPKRVLRGRATGAATKPKTTFAGVEPTPEQQKQRPFAIEPVVDEGQVKARAYRRQPLYVTLAKTSTPLTADQRQALDVYRELHDRSERSFTRSCLDIDHQGQMRRPDDVVHVNKAIREAREAINRVEAALGPIVSAATTASPMMPRTPIPTTWRAGGRISPRRTARLTATATRSSPGR
jgi:hypothetical protein